MRTLFAVCPFVKTTPSARMHQRWLTCIFELPERRSGSRTVEPSGGSNSAKSRSDSDDFRIKFKGPVADASPPMKGIDIWWPLTTIPTAPAATAAEERPKTRTGTTSSSPDRGTFTHVFDSATGLDVLPAMMNRMLLCNFIHRRVTCPWHHYRTYFCDLASGLEILPPMMDI